MTKKYFWEKETYILSIQQKSKHPIAPSWLSAPGFCMSFLTSEENHTFLHSSLTSRIVFLYLAFKTDLKGKYYLREGTKLRKFLFPG